MAALAHDVPVLVLPTDNQTDQPLVGRQVERAGAGRTLRRTSSTGRIRRTLEDLLDDGPHRTAAARLGLRIRELDGANRAADLLERSAG